MDSHPHPESQPQQKTDLFESKHQLRQELSNRRRALSPSEKEAADSKLRSRLLSLIREKDFRTIAAYSPLPSEPGGRRLLDDLAAEFTEIWLPLSGSDGQLTWGLYQEDSLMQQGALGISEPSGPFRDNEVLAELDAVFLPAMAIDSAGYRLGKGAGYYDRALETIDSLEPHRRPSLIAIVYDHEFFAEIPHESHDQPVDAAITPGSIHHIRNR